MAVKSPKQAIEPITTPEPVAQSTAIDCNIEVLIADEILDNLDWQKVRDTLIARARQRFWIWLSSQILPSEVCTVALTEIDAIALSGADEVTA